MIVKERDRVQEYFGPVILKHGMKFEELCKVLRQGAAYLDGKCVHVSGIEREDGSGKCFNVEYYHGTAMKKVFVRVS